VGVDAVTYVGTAGFKYEDWRGPFYPEALPDRDMLRHYATRFGAVELDFTYYQMPAWRTIQGITQKTPADFVVCVKANRTMTHEPAADPAEFSRTCQLFAGALEPLTAAGKLGCILLQFPWGFKPAPEGVEAIRRLREALSGLPAVVEFRNSDWISDETFALLRELGLGFCCVDEPRLRGLMPPLAVATADVGYVRFHGRNAAKWWRHDEAWERYAYLYTDAELREWVPRVKKVASAATRTFVMFNNHHAGFAPRNADMMRELLATPGAPSATPPATPAATPPATPAAPADSPPADLFGRDPA
jgi:uncharacterized protein YecE (DUF72 family)